eukprot:TRINITY_DN24963_c0_g1_i1.p1 TRINITY_DN24963_c0_g1~~TRINITY_DN24963_c0_g1_i1.p1  ORF type:complete len:429 (+),score=88.16 TRINITY_DN24963_c0_g1_i1:82-1368(+)
MSRWRDGGTLVSGPALGLGIPHALESAAPPANARVDGGPSPSKPPGTVDTTDWRDVFPSDELLDSLLDELTRPYHVGSRPGHSRQRRASGSGAGAAAGSAAAPAAPPQRPRPGFAPSRQPPQGPSTPPRPVAAGGYPGPPPTPPLPPVQGGKSPTSSGGYGLCDKDLSPPCTVRSGEGSGSQCSRSVRCGPYGSFRKGPPPGEPLPPSRISTPPMWRSRRPVSVSSWQTRERWSDCGRLPPVEWLPDDALEYILSFLWPPRLLGNVRLAWGRMNQAVESLRVDCEMCGCPSSWCDALMCDGCSEVRCRSCAGVDPFPQVFPAKKFSGQVEGRCNSCGGHVQTDWLRCPWCGMGTKHKSAVRSAHAHHHKRVAMKAWAVHSCGHEMAPRRMCAGCTLQCCICGYAGCRDCAWHDGNRIACFGCTVVYGR